jgi:hypothetical protein
MTPMTGRIAYGQEDWFILNLCLPKGLFAPRIPVYWVISVLK